MSYRVLDGRFLAGWTLITQRVQTLGSEILLWSTFCFECSVNNSLTCSEQAVRITVCCKLFVFCIKKNLELEMLCAVSLLQMFQNVTLNTDMFYM